MKNHSSAAVMTYPPAPWHLYGNALQTFHLIDVEKAKAFVPSDLDVVSVLPGKTLGGVYVSVYDADSTFNYHELIVVSALVRYKGTIGSWVSHIYVDHPGSLAGGRSIWGLPKEMAEFTWGSEAISVTQADKPLCQVQYGSGGLPLSFWGKSKIRGSVFGGLAEDIMVFEGSFEARLKWVGCHLTISTESPFVNLGLGRPVFAIQFQNLYLTANTPAIVGQWTSRQQVVI
jgi:acetoacetate decarboxylase